MIQATVVVHDGAPYVRVTATDHPVYAVGHDRHRRPVRGSYAEVSGVTVVRDYEAPQGEPLTYANSLGETTVVVEVPRSGNWLVPCQLPDLATPIFVEREDGFSGWTYTERRDSLDIPGGAPFVVSTRSKARSTTLNLTTLDAEWTEQMERCLMASGYHFISHDPTFWPLRAATYVEVSGVSSEPVRDAPEPLWRWAVTLTEVDRPAVDQARPVGWAAMPERWSGMPTTWAAVP